MNSREKKLTSLLMVCAGVLVLAFFALVIYPQYQTMSNKADTATDAKNVAEAKLKRGQELKKNEKKIDARLANLQARIPSSIEIPNLIIQIDKTAESNHLTWLQGDPQDTNSLAASSSGQTAAQPNTLAPQLTRYDFTMLVQGNLSDLNKFISEITNKSIGRIIVVNNLDVQFKPDQGPDAIEATLKLQIIGWDKGGDITPGGCIDGTNADATSNDPNCNQSSVDE